MTTAAGANALTLRAQAPALLANLYADASNDPTEGTSRSWTATMALFRIDQANNARNTDTADLRQLAVTAGASDKPMGFTICSYGVAQFYLAFTRMSNSLFMQNSATHNKTFALEGELLEDCGSIVELPIRCFTCCALSSAC